MFLVYRIGYIFFALSFFVFTSVAYAATLSVSPTTGEYTVGDIITTVVTLDTQGAGVQAVDVNALVYDTSKLSVVDEDSGVSDTQVTAGSLMSTTVSNTVNTSTGKIIFSQTIGGGSSYSGSGTFATVRFEALSSGSANIIFDYSPGVTTDSNVASNGSDILSSVQNAVYTISSISVDTTAPTVSFISPTDGLELSGSVTLAANASDNVGVVNVQFFVDRSVIATDTDSPYEAVWDSTGAGNGTHMLTVKSVDVAGNEGSVDISVTVNNPSTSSGGGGGGGGGSSRRSGGGGSSSTSSGGGGDSSSSSNNKEVSNDESNKNSEQSSSEGDSSSNNTTTTYRPTVSFNRNLTIGSEGEDVKQLQRFLNNAGFKIQDSGSGSPGFESTYFGFLTQQALARYQNAYKADVLTPVGVAAGTGYFGPSTRSFINRQPSNLGSNTNVSPVGLSISDQQLLAKIQEILKLIQVLQQRLDAISG